MSDIAMATKLSSLEDLFKMIIKDFIEPILEKLLVCEYML
jgi:hypothetical protein